MENLPEIINEAASYIQSIINGKPAIGLIMGTGLGNLAEHMQIDHVIPYASIPHFPVSTVKGHGGNLLAGRIAGKNVLAMQGRFHYYEGYSMKEIGLPVWVMGKLGVQTLFVSNASGGLNPAYNVGDIVFVTDHINLVTDNPLRGKNFEELGPRFPDQHALYQKYLVAKAVDLAAGFGIPHHTGVYVGVPGPTFETPAEYKYMRIIGGDIVGMSTIPEVIVANHCGMQVFCLSVVTDLGNPPVPISISHDEVIAAANSAEPRMRLIIENLIESLPV